MHITIHLVTYGIVTKMGFKLGGVQVPLFWPNVAVSPCTL